MYLYGAGGHAKVIMDILEECRTEVSGIVDDNPDIQTFMGREIISGYRKGISPVIISIGSNAIRKRIAGRLYDEKVVFGTAVSVHAVVSPRAVIGEGTVVMQGSILQSDCRIGRHCIINTGASVDHECVIGDYAHISPHATLCGNVQVGEETWVGAGTVVNPGIKIGKGCVIGSGSVVCRDIPDGVVAYGSPCKVIRKNKQS